MKIRLYLDNCSYNRPYDEKEQLSVSMEAEAKLHIQKNIRNGIYELVWSYMNEYENSENPYDYKREAIGLWSNIAENICLPGKEILERGKAIQSLAIKPKDSLNLACAIESGCQYFITTEKSLLNKAKLLSNIKIINPIDFIREEEKTNGNDY